MRSIEELHQVVEILDKLRSDFGDGRSLDWVIPNPNQDGAAQLTVNLLGSLRELAQFCREKPEEVPGRQKRRMNMLLKDVEDALSQIRVVRGDVVADGIQQAANELGKAMDRVPERHIEKLDQAVEILDEFDFALGVNLDLAVPNPKSNAKPTIVDSLRELAQFCREKPNEVPVPQKRRMNILVQDVNKNLDYYIRKGYPRDVADGIRQAAAELKIAVGNVPGRRPAAPPENKGGESPRHRP